MPRPELNQLIVIKPYFRWIIPLFFTFGLIGLLQTESCSVFEETVSYNRDIRPILNKNCLSCHGGVKESGGFSLLFEEDALGPTESGVPAIIPGDPEGSEMIRRLRHSDPELRMPQEKEPLSEEEIDILKTWIRQGAKWEDHWAYIPPDENIKPPSLNDAWVKNGIDAFILRRLNEKKLTPNEAADEAVLLRRASLDLTGLPPAPALQDAYMAGNVSWENVLDSLMASPHFGEKWAAWRMDLARYADSKGYEKDLNRSIWKYRDWVIQAFNEDLSFDQFTVQQLAGDMLPDATEDQIIATAFHRNSIANDEGGTDDEEFRVAANIERVGVTWEVWQGTTMACVQCHSHPYDPFRHEDFYRFMAFLNSTQDKDIYNEQPKLFTYPDSSVDKVEELMEWITKKAANDLSFESDTFLYEQRSRILYQMGYRRVEAEEYQDHSRFIELTSPDQLSVFQIQDSSWIMYENVDLTDVEKITYRFASAYSGGFVEIRLDSLNGPVISKTLLPGTKRWVNWEEKTVNIQSVSGTHNLYYYFYMNQDYVSDLFRLDWIQYHLKDSPSDGYEQEMKAKLAQLWEISAVQTPVMRELKGEDRRTSYRFLRGNWLTPGEEVAPGIPGSMQKNHESSPTNRLEMAQWLISADNPLTARVIVNRLWEQVFGYGIVETPEDFGSQGIVPTHPEMLDWLAVRFVKEHQWSLKSFLKEIMLSATYQQSSVADSAKIEADPRNLLLSRGPRVRLSAEQIRD
ncbi:MAG: DUF1549 domain-containing protein, partial [Bacteroidetes bacterium]|nr:DUF1549 domain-containing protein [Bacteroidota bacterium]